MLLQEKHVEWKPSNECKGNHSAVNDFASLLLEMHKAAVASYTKETKAKVNMAIKNLCTPRNSATKHYELPKSLNTNIINVINGGGKAHTPVELSRGALTQFHQNLNKDNINCVSTESIPQLYNKKFWSHIFTPQWNSLKTSRRVVTYLMTHDTTWTPLNVAPKDELTDDYCTQ
jgi:hypothetical protein